jgi:hypothetical protein
MRAVLTLLTVLGAAPATAQIGGTDPLMGICSGVLAQSPGGVSGDRNKLCTCLVRETPAQLTPTEMLAYAEAAQAGRAPPDAVMQKITRIATQCLQEAR